MRICKFYMVILLGVVASLLYIHQHIEIVKLNYVLNENENEVAQLLDQNRALVYNIEKLENPNLLKERLDTGEWTFTMPKTWCVVRLGEPEKKVEVAGYTSERKSIFDFLVPKALAQGRPAE